MTVTKEVSVDSDHLTELISRWQVGCKKSEEQIFRFAYCRLKELAQQRRQKSGASLNKESTNTTALIHESYLKVSVLDKGAIEKTRDFYLMAAKAMQHILINQAWAAQADKRQPDQSLVIEKALSIEGLPLERRIALEQSLVEFTNYYPRQSNVLKLKYYIGLRHTEICQLLECSSSLVEKDLKFAKSWLHSRLAA
ncbi:DNA-directed RNA polymerase subunit sigma [Vibrio fortis]|uniref:DNA-directed RNA polymerase subunit sigma n=1 Tax=Vibrio fortis TaxID=212667 RepID=A0A066UJV7_9VIBR|nr:ECF-type sigma factor [Vibrio fortis]KDN27671.1 DNA-directed RNA polymerase subunit sigma [Vibrio fortis]